MAQRAASLTTITSEFQELLRDPQLPTKLTEAEFFFDYAKKSKLGNLVFLSEQNFTAKRCVDQWYQKISALSDEKAKQRWMQALASFEYLPAKGFIILQQLWSLDPHERVGGRIMLSNWGKPSPPPRALVPEVESRTSSDSTNSSSSTSNRSSGSSESEFKKGIPSLPSRLTNAIRRGVLTTDIPVDIFSKKNENEEFSAIDLIPQMDVIDRVLGVSNNPSEEPFDTDNPELSPWADNEGASIEQNPDISQITKWAHHDKNIAYRLSRFKKFSGEERLEWLKKAVRHGHWYAYFDLGCYLYKNFQKTHNLECLAQSALLFLLLDEFFLIATQPVSPHLKQFAHLEEFKAYPIPSGVDPDRLPQVYLDFQQKIKVFLDGKSDLNHKKQEFAHLKADDFLVYQQAYKTYFYPLVNSTPPPSPHPEKSDPGSPVSVVINYDLLNKYTNGWFSDRHQGRAAAVLAALQHQPPHVVREIVQIQVDLFEGKRARTVSEEAKNAFTDESIGCFGKTGGWERWLSRLDGRKDALQSKFYLAMKNILTQMNEDEQPEIEFPSAAAPLLPKKSGR